jgi:large subunit ribosomal protein L4
VTKKAAPGKDAPVKTWSGEEHGRVSLAEEVFGVRPNGHVVYETVKAYLANQRQGTAKAKTRAEVRGGTRKPWRQKGTGRARAGTVTSPLWRHGGRIFGPRPRDYRMEIPKKIRRLALKSALSDRAQDGRILVLESLDLREAKTKEVAAFLKANELGGKSCLLVVEAYDEKVARAARNIPRLSVRVWDELNAHDVVRSEWLVITKSALEAMQRGASS